MALSYWKLLNKTFIDHVQEIYAPALNVEKANRSVDQANYRNLTFITGNNNRLYTKLYDKVTISTFTLSTFHSCRAIYHLALHMTTHILMTFRYSHKFPVNRLFFQGYKVNRLITSSQKFYGRKSRSDYKVSEVS